MTKYRIIRVPSYSRPDCYVYEVQLRSFFGWTDVQGSGNPHLSLEDAEKRVRELQSAPRLDPFRVVKEFDR